MMQLTKTQIQTLNTVEVNIKSLFKNDFTGHDYDHIKRVVNLTTRLLVEEANHFVTLMIAYFHDVFDDKLIVNTEYSTLNDYVVAWQLDLDGFDAEIAEGIKSIGFKGGFVKVEKSLEATIVSDADYLDSMGAIGIGRAFYYAGSKGLPFHDSDLEGLVATDYDSYRNLQRNAIAHFDEKLLKLKNYIVTPKGRELAERRHQVLQEFYKEFYDELG